MEVMDIDKGEVSLRWARPADDGGDRIQGYMVEYKPVGGHWAKYNDAPIKELDCTGENLTLGLKLCYLVNSHI